jgi:hypothetical protein
MFDIILLIIILTTLIYLIYQNLENMTDFNFKFLNSKFSEFMNVDIYESDEYIEILKLPKVDLNIKYDYETNYNLLINNNISIYQDMADQLKHTIEIDNINYNLISIRWKISRFLYNNLNVGLDLHLVHKNFNSLHNVILVIPLNLTNCIEKFKNINYKKMTTEYSIYTNTILEDSSKYKFTTPDYYLGKFNLDDKINNQKDIFNLKLPSSKKLLNNLITNKDTIPSYECCKDSIGNNINFDLSVFNELLSDNNSFYKLYDRDNNIYYITDPKEFDENIGLNIYNKITIDNLITYMK